LRTYHVPATANATTAAPARLTPAEASLEPGFRERDRRGVHRREPEDERERPLHEQAEPACQSEQEGVATVEEPVRANQAIERQSDCRREGRVEHVLLEGGDEHRRGHDEDDREQADARVPQPAPDRVGGENEDDNPDGVAEHRDPHRLVAE
jgi:hypothetical protein